MTGRTISISWSSLRAHEECKQRALLRRTGHSSPAKNIRSYFHGMVVDRIMRAWLTDPDHPAGGMRAMVDTIIETEALAAKTGGDGIVRWRHASDKDDVRRFCLDLCARLEPILRDLVLPYPFANGLRFAIPLTAPHPDGGTGTVKLTGELDLLVRTPPGAVIWDLKGTADNAYYRKVLGQLVFYDIAMTIQDGAYPVGAGFIQPMCDEPVMAVSITGEERAGLLSRIMRMADDMWREAAPCTSSTSQCGFCDVTHACARFQPIAGTRTMPLTLADELREAARSTW